MSTPQDPATGKPRAAHSQGLASDSLISIADIRRIFGLGRTAAYELTHRPGFPDPVPVSPRCYRWWASEVDVYADSLRLKRSQQSVGATRRATKPNASCQATPPRRITGTVRPARTRKETS